MTFQILTSFDPTTYQYSTMTVEGDTPDDLIIWGWDHFQQCNIYADETVPQPLTKFDKNFNHRRKVEFESELALTVFQYEEMFKPVLCKVGKAMGDFLQGKLLEAKNINREQAFLETAGDVFTEYFFSDKEYLGRLGTPEDGNLRNAFKLATQILNDGSTLEHMLTTFMAVDSFYEDYFGVKEQKEEPEISNKRKSARTTLIDNTLFKNRGRAELYPNAIPSTAFGITDEKSSLPYQLTPHFRPIDTYSRDFENVTDFVYDAYMREIPYVCGPSATTSKLLSSALAMTSFTLEELRMYTLACAAFLIGAGAHSFHEIYTIADKLNIGYRIGRYENALPDSFKQSVGFRNLLQKFPDIIKTDTTKELIKEINDETKSSHTVNFFKEPRPLAPATLAIQKATLPKMIIN